MMSNTFLIIPGNDDTNRGDQALVWATKDLIDKRLSDTHSVKMVCDIEKSAQSIEAGIDVLHPILEHPSRVFKNKNNLKYSFFLKIKWGIVALFDLLLLSPLLSPFFRSIFYLFLTKEKKETYKEIKNCNSIFVKGGGFLHCGKGIAGWYKIFFCLFHIRLGLAFKKDVYVMPNSFGPINNGIARRMCSCVLKKCKVVYARETISYDYLKKQLDIKKAILMPDLGFSLQAKQNNMTEKIKKDILLKANGRQLFGITARPYRFDEVSSNSNTYYNYILSLVEFIKARQNEGMFPVLFEHVYSDNFNERDSIAISDIVSRLDEDSFFIVSERRLDCKEIAELYTINSFMVGTRFHSVIFSFNAAVPCIAITYGGYKGVGILRDIGINECGIPMNNISYNLLEHAYNYLVTNRKSIVTKINEYVCESKEKIKHIVEELAV